MTKDETRIYKVETLEKAQALLTVKAQELEKLSDEILSHIDELPSLVEIGKFQRDLRCHERDLFDLQNSLKKLPEKNIPQKHDEWEKASAECNTLILDSTAFSDKVTAQKEQKIKELEKSTIDVAVFLFNASVPPSAVYSLAKDAGFSNSTALSIAAVFFAFGIAGTVVKAAGLAMKKTEETYKHFKYEAKKIAAPKEKSGTRNPLRPDQVVEEKERRLQP